MVVGDCTAGNGISNANNIAKRCLMKTRLSWCCTLLASFMDFNGIMDYWYGNAACYQQLGWCLEVEIWRFGIVYSHPGLEMAEPRKDWKHFQVIWFQKRLQGVINIRLVFLFLHQLEQAGAVPSEGQIWLGRRRPRPNLRRREVMEIYRGNDPRTLGISVELRTSIPGRLFILFYIYMGFSSTIHCLRGY